MPFRHSHRELSPQKVQSPELKLLSSLPNYTGNKGMSAAQYSDDSISSKSKKAELCVQLLGGDP